MKITNAAYARVYSKNNVSVRDSLCSFDSLNQPYLEKYATSDSGFKGSMVNGLMALTTCSFN